MTGVQTCALPISTAVYATLQQHPQVFLPGKEPHYFAPDFPTVRQVETIEDYERLFADAERTQLRGEASVLYLSSKEATAAILRRRPDAKLIAMVRNPLDMFVSWHNQALHGRARYEEEVDPRRAWLLQEERAQGRRIPKCCKEPELLQYKRLCGLGAQIESLFRLVPERQRLVIVFDDLQQQPRQVYRQIVEFLGVEDDGTDCFARENVFGKPRSAFIAGVIRFAMNLGATKLGSKVKPAFRKYGVRMIDSLGRHNVKYVAKPTLSSEFRRELEAAFAQDVQLLERLLCRDLCKLWSIGDTPAHAETGNGDRSLARL